MVIARSEYDPILRSLCGPLCPSIGLAKTATAISRLAPASGDTSLSRIPGRSAIGACRLHCHSPGIPSGTDVDSSMANDASVAKVIRMVKRLFTNFDSTGSR